MAESTMSGNPFELSDEEKQKKVEEAREARLAQREKKDNEDFENGTGRYSDGKVIEIASRAGNKAMDVGEQAVDGFVNAMEEAASLPGTVQEKLSGEQPEAQGPVDDTPPIQLRMSK